MIIHMRCGECEHYTGGICYKANPSCIVKRTYPWWAWLPSIIASTIAIIIALSKLI